MPANILSRVHEKGSYAHIYNKGIENRIIFIDDEDYKVFLNYLRGYLSPPADPESTKKVFSVNGRTFRGTPHQAKNYYEKIELLSYSLSDDHFHLVLQQLVDGALQSFIRSLSTRYSMYYNKKYNRRGALLDSPYKLAHINDTTRLLHLIYYIHSNHKQNTYSSQTEYLGQRQTPWINSQRVLSSTDIEGRTYKNFIQKYEFNEKERGFVNGITLEKDPTYQGQSPPAALPQTLIHKTIQPDSIRLSRFPEFLALGIFFLLLVGISGRNIYARNQYLALKTPSPVTTIDKTLAVASPTPMTSETTGVLSTSSVDSSTLAQKLTAKEIIIVKTTTELGSVTVLERPANDSTIVATAKDGESFELVSQGSEWFQILLADGTTGFISTQSAYIDQKEHQ